jgi:photoactive yellow protein
MGDVDVSALINLSFDDADIFARLGALAPAELDFGVIGFNADSVVTTYNVFESKAAGLSIGSVVGQPIFTTVAPCMNNFMVAQRFEDAAAQNEVLDATIDYVLTLRMRPVKVALRLLARPGQATRYVLVRRRS